MSKQNNLPRTIDWVAVKAEFMAGNESFNKFRLRHKFGLTWFSKMAKGWLAERNNLRLEAFKEVQIVRKEELKDEYSKFADAAKKLIFRTTQEIEAVYERTFDKDGKRIGVLGPDKITNLSNALSTAIKSFRLIEGKSTENVETRNLHLAAVAILEGIDGNNQPK